MKKQIKSDLQIDVSSQFSENPDAVLVFTSGQEVSKKRIDPLEGSKSKLSEGQMGDQGIRGIRKNIALFSREDFFYKEIIDAFHDSFFYSRPGETFSVYKQGRYRQIVYLGVEGYKDNGVSPNECLENLRMSLGQLVNDVQLDRCLEVDLTEAKSMADFLHVEVSALVEAICDGLMLGGYRFDDYRFEKGKVSFNKLVLVIPEHLEMAQKIGEERVVVSNAALLARTLINEPPNVLGVREFSTRAETLTKKHNIRFNFLNKKQLKQKNMNGLLAVNEGSDEEAKLLFLEYLPSKHSAKDAYHVLVVGKGVLFDSGGLSLKPAKGMEEMKMDMSGAAVALASILAIAELQLPIRWTVALPLTDNMPSSKAIKVGSVVSMYNGKTVEILNTDAEGRLILADALSYCTEKYSPNCVVDIATLTGSIMSALGSEYAGLFSNDKKLADLLAQSGDAVGEKLWQMPLDDNYKKLLKSNVADLKNIGGAFAGSITAAKFLQDFVGGAKWAHIDIAGVMSQASRSGYRSEGARGFGVRMLCEFAKRCCQF